MVINIKAASHQRNRLPQRLHIDDAKLWQQVVFAPKIISFFDFDGTLVEIAPTPADVNLAKPCKRWLNEILSLPGCSAAVVSGRPIDDLRRLIGLDRLFYVGCHGLEWAAPDGVRHTSWLNRLLVDALRALRSEMRATMATFEGVIIEDKGMSLALHYRLAGRATATAARKEFVRAVSWYQQQGAKLELISGKEVIEAKPAGTTKGDAITQIWARYAPTALPIYIGDDTTDESAFEAIADKGLAVLVAETPRLTAAQMYLKNPTEVYVFLRCLTHMREKGYRQ
jgi:trehalose-phosphatase